MLNFSGSSAQFERNPCTISTVKAHSDNGICIELEIYVLNKIAMFKIAKFPMSEEKGVFSKELEIDEPCYIERMLHETEIIITM